MTSVVLGDLSHEFGVLSHRSHASRLHPLVIGGDDRHGMFLDLPHSTSFDGHHGNRVHASSQADGNREDDEAPGRHGGSCVLWTIRDEAESSATGSSLHNDAINIMTASSTKSPYRYYRLNLGFHGGRTPRPRISTVASTGLGVLAGKTVSGERQWKLARHANQTS